MINSEYWKSTGWGRSPPPGSAEDMDGWVPAERDGRQVVCRVRSLVRGKTRPKPLHSTARTAADQQQSRTTSRHSCTRGSTTACGTGAVRGLTAGHGRGDTVATQLDQEEMEDKTGVPGCQQGPVDGDAEPRARPQGPYEVG